VTREQKLEAALKSAIRMRKAMIDIGEPVINLFVPREAVAEFDSTLKELSERKNDVNNNS
jgi:hypothetical protein